MLTFFSFLFYYKCLITKWNFCQLVNNIIVVFSLLVFYEIVMWNRDVVIIHQMELTAAMAVREQDPDSTADRSSESDSSDSEVVSFPVVVLSLPTNTTHFKKNTNKIPMCTWWRANAPPLYLIFNLINIHGALVSSAESISDSKVYFCTRLKGVLSDTQSSYRHEF